MRTSKKEAAGDLSQYELFKKDVEGYCIKINRGAILKPFDENLPTTLAQKAVNKVENKFVFDIYQKLDRSKFVAKNVRPAEKNEM